MSTTVTETVSTETIIQPAQSAAQSTTGEVFYRSTHLAEQPNIVVSSKGMEYYMEDGSTMLDACGGAGVSCIGNGIEEVIEAMKEQIEKCSFAYFVWFTTSPAEELATLLCERSQGVFDKVGYTCGGSEAVESMLKLARQYYVEINQPKRVNFISRKVSYHGNTMGSLGASYHPVRKTIYEPILAIHAFHHVEPAFSHRHCPEGMDEEAYVEHLRKDLEAKFEELGGETVVAFVAETVVGSSTGAVAPPKGYFLAMKSVCDKYGALLLLDEVMCGMGRCGTTHAWELFGDGVKPDIQTVAKGLGGGYQPIGAVLLSPKVSNAVASGSGNWIVKWAYLSVSSRGLRRGLSRPKVYFKNDLLSNVRTNGAYLGERLHTVLLENTKTAPYIGDIRGVGAIWSVEFVADKATKRSFDVTMKPRFATRVTKAAMMQEKMHMLGIIGCIDGVVGDAVLIMPAYTVSREQVDDIVGRLGRAVEVAVATL